MIKGLNYYWQFTQNQHKGREEIVLQQNAQLRRIIRHAYKTTAFYRKMMDRADVKPEQINCVEDLKLLPTVSKAQIQKDFHSFVSRRYNIDKCLTRRTSGSSGKVLSVVWDRDNFWARVFLFYRTFVMIGYNPFRKALYFLPECEDTGFRFGLFRLKHLPLDKPFEEIRKILKQYKPHILSVYPSYALDLGKQFSPGDITAMNIRAISLNSEIILPHDKALISEIYKCPVFEEYSTVETGIIASSCKHGGMHVFTDNVVLEILDSNGAQAAPGEKGEVVLTTLNSYAMPFIRYRIGDYASVLQHADACACGSPFPLLGHVEGRSDDAFILRDGTRVPAWKIYEIVERPLDADCNLQIFCDFYIVQKGYDNADFYYVRGRDFDQAYVDNILIKSSGLFGRDFVLSVHEVNDINRVKSVKRKYIHVDIKNNSAVAS